jgi:hypothetical protein
MTIAKLKRTISLGKASADGKIILNDIYLVNTVKE